MYISNTKERHGTKSNRDKNHNSPDVPLVVTVVGISSRAGVAADVAGCPPVDLGERMVIGVVRLLFLIYPVIEHLEAMDTKNPTSACES